MLLVILGICILLFIIGVIFNCDDFGVVCGVTGGCGTVVSILILFFMLVGYPYNIEEKITMYQEENILIEEKIKNTVRTYMDYEESTYKELVENADLTTLVIKYPELNSNELVKSEIQTYKENSDMIKSLKESKINKKTLNWWLYFGN